MHIEIFWVAILIMLSKKTTYSHRMVDHTEGKPKGPPAGEQIGEEIVRTISDFIAQSIPLLTPFESISGALKKIDEESFEDLRDEQKDLRNEIITANQSCNELKDKAKVFLRSLETSINNAIMSSQCGQSDEKTLKKFAEDIDKTIMKKKLGKLKKSNGEAKKATTVVNAHLSEMVRKCGEKINNLPQVEDDTVSKKRWDQYLKLGEKFAGWVTLVNILGAFQPAVQIGAGIAGIALHVAHTERNVANLRKEFKEVYANLQKHQQHWSQMQNIVDSLLVDLEKLSDHWNDLKAGYMPEAHHVCELFLGTSESEVETREQFKVKFDEALAKIRETCKEALNVDMMKKEIKIEDEVNI